MEKPKRLTQSEFELREKLRDRYNNARSQSAKQKAYDALMEFEEKYLAK